MALCYKFPDILANKSLYQALVFLLQDRFRLDTSFPSTVPGLQAIQFNSGGEELNLPFVISTFGLLAKDNFTDPLLGKDPNGPDITNGKLPDGTQVKFARRFVEQVASAVQEFQGNKPMYTQVLSTLAADGSTPAGVTVFATQVAEVSRRLVEERRDADDPQIGVRINNVLSVVLGDGVQGRASAIDINLPSLDEDTTADILVDNVTALAAVYFAAQLEELKFFATADKVMEHFITGMLPLSRGAGGEAIYEYMKDTPNRMTEVERRSLYARAFGFAQGSVDEPLPNREFQDSWIRFLSAESQFVRLFGPSFNSNKVLMQGPIIPIEQVFKSAKDLAVNLSLHGYGIAHFAAVELQQLVRDVKAMLSFDDVLKAYGVLDQPQLVERVSSLYLGGSVNGVQKRTMATAGANIIQWLARYAPALSGSDSGGLAKLIFTPKDPTDPIDNIANNVERWLAVTGTVDAAVEKFAEPISVPTQATIPNLSLQAAVPDALRNALSQVGTALPAMPALQSNGFGGNAFKA
jgi:hypothetical protein